MEYLMLGAVMMISTAIIMAAAGINSSELQWDTTVDICTDIYQQTKNETMYYDCWAPFEQQAYGLVYNISGIPYMYNNDSEFQEVITQYHTNGTNNTVLQR